MNNSHAKKESNFIGLAHISIYTADMEKSIRFYTENFEFEKVYESIVENDNGNMKFAIVKLDNCIIEFLEPANKEGIETGKKGSIDHFAIEVKNLPKVVEKLKANNVEFTSDIFALEKLLNGIEGAFLKGPNGEKIELFEFKNGKPF
jgi:lactoylglutathione lyase